MRRSPLFYLPRARSSSRILNSLALLSFRFLPRRNCLSLFIHSHSSLFDDRLRSLSVRVAVMRGCTSTVGRLVAKNLFGNHHIALSYYILGNIVCEYNHTCAELNKIAMFTIDSKDAMDVFILA